MSDASDLRAEGRRLLILRHAKAQPEAEPERGAFDGPGGDHARALAPRGRAEAERMGQILREAGLLPELALVSSALRTRQTLDLLSLPASAGSETLILDRLYLAEAREVLLTLREVPDTVRSVLVVGHNPGLHELVLALAGAAATTPELRAGFPTCTLALLALDDRWAALDPQRPGGGVRLQRLLHPGRQGRAEA